jgi:DNA-binding NtrC family response regulator
MASSTPPIETPSAGVPLRLLQVEHEPGEVELCIRELKKSGLEFHAETVATREQFVQKLLVQSFDIIIADYRLPGWTGMDALAEMKRLGLNIPVILVTGALGDGVAVESLKQGITDYVLKDQLSRLPAAVVRAQEEKTSRDAEARAVDALRASEARYRGLVPECNLRNALGHYRRHPSIGESRFRSDAWI